MKAFIESFNLLDFNKEVCEQFGKEYTRLKKIGKLIPEFDLITACFAKVNDLTLVTRDNHFKNIDIKTEIW